MANCGRGPFGSTLNDDMDDGGRLHPLYAGRTGICTSFAIKAVRSLKAKAPLGTYDFVFYDLGKHRLARCRKAKIMIDSDATDAPKLEDGKTLIIQKKTLFCKNLTLEFHDGNVEKLVKVCGSSLIPGLPFAHLSICRQLGLVT